MNINHIPVSPHNAKAWDLKEIDMTMTLRCPDKNGVLTICDPSEEEPQLATLSLAALTDNRGFTAKRTDGVPMQAQYVGPRGTYDPHGTNVFIEPVEFLPVRHDFVTERWHIDVDPDNVNSVANLNILVWALAHHGLKKKKKLLTSIYN